MNNRHNLNRLAYFVATIEEGTITAAAERLNLSKAVVSKQLQLLEQDVGVTLLQRNTRNMQATDAGQVFYEKSKLALIQANEAFDTVLERAQVPTGRVRVTAPVDYGISHIAPLVARFRDMYPMVEVDLVLSDEQLDIIEGRYDVAFRVGWLKDSNNLARKLRSFNEIAVCSPTTLENNVIEEPEDLATLPFIVNQALENQTRWTLKCGKRTRTVDMQKVMSMNITTAIRGAVMAGQCFTILPDFLVTEDLANKKLVQLLPDWSLRSGGLYTVTPPGQLRASAVKAFLKLAQQDNASAVSLLR